MACSVISPPCYDDATHQQYNQQQMYVGQPQQPASVQQIMPPQPPPMSHQPIQSQALQLQAQQNRNGPIYVPSNVSKVNQAAAATAQQLAGVIPTPPPNMYAAQPVQQVPVPPQQPQQQQIANNGYGQTNGGYGNPQQFGSQVVSI